MTARVARLCPPGRWWYLAVCEDCAWSGLSWKYKWWAEQERNDHNKVHAEADRLRVEALFVPRPTESDDEQA